MFKVERAIFLAAGMGSRLAPVTDKVPKPLVKVNGKRIIETLLDAVLVAGIKEIYLVRGYRGETFGILRKDYPMINFIDNPDYEGANNISSVFCAGKLVQNAYIIESDLLLSTPGLITSYQDESNYLAIPMEKTNDWCFYLGEDGYINRMAVGGKNCEQMVGISYWTEKDGARLAERTAELYGYPENRQLYWDEVALDKFLPEFRLRTRHCTRADVVEIDTLKELQEIDSSYIGITGGK